MIRIDEIYYNTFLPLVQDKLYHGIHWFDPFGSVKFDDLISMPIISSALPDDIMMIPNHDVVRFLFWDQEPLHKDTIDQTLTSFTKLFDVGTRHIITSEYNSEMVEYVKNTYGFIPHYYFFHGWAALDWFRGYNRSFLMTPPSQRTIVKTFVAPNRIVAGQRQHRLLMLYHMFQNKLNHNWISCPDICPAENISITEAVEPLTGIYSDIQTVFSQQQLPKNFPNEIKHPMQSYQLDLFDQTAESLLYVVTETVAQGRRQHLTEKIFKPICLQIPFVLVGTAGGLEYLRSYGFKTFDTVWDESYDHEVNDIVRIEKISKLLTELDGLTNKEKQQLYHHALPIIEHNYQHFYGGEFEKILWQELNSMIENFI
jgi:hypothetical protein